MDALTDALASLDVRAEAKGQHNAPQDAAAAASTPAVRVHITRASISLSHPAFAEVHGEPVLEMAGTGTSDSRSSAHVDKEESAAPTSSEAATDMVAKLAAAVRGEGDRAPDMAKEQSGQEGGDLQQKLTDQAAPLYPLASQPRKNESYAHYLERLCVMAPHQPPKPTVREQHTPKKAQKHEADGDSSDEVLERESEVPLGWPQGDLYLCGPATEGKSGQGQEGRAADGGSKAAIEASVGAIDRALDGIFAPAPATAPPSPAFVVVRPPGHHCGSATPSGFCWVNNVLVGASLAQKKFAVDRVIVLDIDLHHGSESIMVRPLSDVSYADAQRL